jgi:hypothetical protein
MYRKALASIALALAFAGTATAQATTPTVTFTAIIEPATLPSICQEETHVVACNGALLKSTTLDLTKYEGKPFEFKATLGGVECKIWNVTSVGPAKGTLVHCGSAVPGCPMRMRVGPSGVIGQWFLWFSLSSDFVPLDPVTGTLMLGAPLHFLGSGPTAGVNQTYDFVIPNSPSVVGLDIFAQGARMDIGPVGPLTLTNPTCFTIAPFMPPCAQPNC